MQYIAFIWNDHTVSWSGIILALAALAAVLLALALRTAQGRPVWHVALLALLSTVSGVYLSRFIHWYCNAAQYSSLGAAMTDFSTGGLAATGAFFGVLLSALLLRALRVYDDLPAVLDCVAPAGALGLAVGRMACLLSTANRSKFMLADEAFHRLPFTVLSTTASGAQEWRIATFCLEAISSAVILAVLLVLFFTVRKKPRFRASWQDGNIFLLFLALYGAITVVLDSTRYDAGYLRSNGFVSLTQICCVVGLMLALGIYLGRSIIARGMKLWDYPLFALIAGAAGLGGYMEYFVQRRGNRFIFAYSVMESCFMLLFLITLALFFLTGAQKGVPQQAARPPREKGRPSKTAALLEKLNRPRSKRAETPPIYEGDGAFPPQEAGVEDWDAYPPQSDAPYAPEDYAYDGGAYAADPGGDWDAYPPLEADAGLWDAAVGAAPLPTEDLDYAPEAFPTGDYPAGELDDSFLNDPIFDTGDLRAYLGTDEMDLSGAPGGADAPTRGSGRHQKKEKNSWLSKKQ